MIVYPYMYEKKKMVKDLLNDVLVVNLVPTKLRIKIRCIMAGFD